VFFSYLATTNRSRQREELEFHASKAEVFTRRHLLHTSASDNVKCGEAGSRSAYHLPCTQAVRLHDSCIRGQASLFRMLLSATFVICTLFIWPSRAKDQLLGGTASEYKNKFSECTASAYDPLYCLADMYKFTPIYQNRFITNALKSC
jgi:hypothetical protein